MDKSKIISIILLVVILGIGFIAFTFYDEKQSLLEDNKKVKQEKAVLIKNNANLTDRYDRAKEELDSAEKKILAVQEAFADLQEEREEWREKWEEASRQKEELTEKIKKISTSKISIVTQQPLPEQQAADEHWIDFIEKKAMLEASLSDLNSEVLDAKTKIAELQNYNKELSVKIDQIAKDKQKLQEDVIFKEKAMRIMSIDLINEREERNSVLSKLKSAQTTNLSLKRELVLASRDKMDLQKSYKEIRDKKIEVENRIIDIENILKEKSSAFEQLQSQLEQVITRGETPNNSVSVELPAIVVKPDTLGLQGVQGEVIAINTEEKFIVVDIGENSGIRPGVLLRVTRAGEEIGEVEVIETRKEISAADIKETISGWIIQEGDTVVSK
ncbi:MAG: hypothetical protein ABIH08_03735 [Candidatus Omnitrophota bacterium]